MWALFWSKQFNGLIKLGTTINVVLRNHTLAIIWGFSPLLLPITLYQWNYFSYSCSNVLNHSYKLQLCLLIVKINVDLYIDSWTPSRKYNNFNHLPSLDKWIDWIKYRIHCYYYDRLYENLSNVKLLLVQWNKIHATQVLSIYNNINLKFKFLLNLCK